MLARLPADIQARFRAYAAGVNAWIDHVRQTPADLPLEFSALKIPLRPWSVLDSLRIGVLLARTIPTGDGEELDNLAALRAFGPSTFAKILPLRVPGQITTIPAADGTFPSQPGRTRAQERAAFARSQRFVRSLPLAPVVGAVGGRAHRAGEPGPRDRRRPRPPRRLVHVGDPAAQRRAHVPLQRPPARLPGAVDVRRARPARPRHRCARRHRAGRPDHGPGPQRARRLGLYQRAVGRQRPLRRATGRTGVAALSVPRARADDVVPARGLPLPRRRRHPRGAEDPVPQRARPRPGRVGAASPTPAATRCGSARSRPSPG